MFSSKSNKKLGAIFGILLAIVLLMFITDGGRNERTFREVLVDIDTSNVSEIIITSKTNAEVKLYKDSDLWKVRLSDEKSVSVPESKIKNMLNQLIALKPKRLAARSESKWGEFQVDTAGTRVVVKEDGSEALNLIIGRFSFQQPRTMNTYVRLSNDVDVYEVDGFLQPTFNQDANSYRDGRILGGKTEFEKWKNLEFEYQADSSFQLVKLNDKWRTIKNQVDSAKTVQYLRQISNLSSSNFIDSVDVAMFNNPAYLLKIEQEEGEPIEIKAFVEDQNYLIQSSANTEAYFDGSQNDLWKKIFIGEKSLLPD